MKSTISALTLSPAIDKTVYIDGFRVDEVNKAQGCCQVPGLEGGQRRARAGKVRRSLRLLWFFGRRRAVYCRRAARRRRRRRFCRRRL